MARMSLRKGVSNSDFLPPEEIGNAIIKHLNDYNDHMAEGTQKAVQIVSEEVMEEIKKNIAFKNRTGGYVKAFALKESYSTKYNKRNTWHVKSPYHGTTHLLEKGHEITLRNGIKTGRSTRAFPHIVYGEQLADKRLQELILKVAAGENI